MDIARIIVLIWFALPILYFLFTRYLLRGVSERYHPIASGQVTDTFMYLKTNRDGTQMFDSMVAYSFHVKANEYTSTAVPSYWGEHQRGDAIKVRYNPKSPKESQIIHLGRTREWMILGLLWLSASLGNTFFSVCSVLLVVYGTVVLFKTFLQPFTLQGFFTLSPIVLFILFFGFLYIEAGVETFSICGFTGQNWLWTLWNHLRICSVL